MIERLLAEAQAEADKKAYCDKEMAESNAKKEDKTAEIAKLTTKIDKMSAQSTQLKAEVATLQKELAELAKAQAEMDKLRSEEKAAYEANRPELEAGVEGVKLALKILRDYYASEGKAHGAAEGAGSTIIGLLEVAESDFAKHIAEMSADETTSQSAYDRETSENKVARAQKEQDVKYKTKEFKGLDNSL